ncbi:SLBB domain-containing protein [Mongoliitalea daihaiensis]|nr:SLBB domain-containing protein [Mongoliitalea daihaiensis]
MADIANIKVDELSDDQLQELVRRASEAGLSESQLLQMARLRGVPVPELEKLKRRLEQLDTAVSSRTSATASKRDPRRQMDFNEITQGLFKYQEDIDELAASTSVSPIFGIDLFYNKNRRLTFEPNINLPTPKSYILGPGDMIYIDIYGQSEQYYEAVVNPDGFVLLDNIGPISVSGKSIEEATGIIKSRVGNFYTGLRGNNPNTFLQVTLGNVRTIKVHLVGELRLPGTFTLSAFSSVFNALFAAGGPSENGTFRNIKVMRSGRQVAVIDVYEFLVQGKANLDFQLQDQDVILVEPFLGRVQVKGEVKRPKIFEIKNGETFEDVLTFAGGFTDEAYKDRISVSRVSGKERAVSDIFLNQMGMFIAKGGDEYEIGKILGRYQNRVQIKGAVFREGNFALQEGMTLKQLIALADGLRGDAFMGRASILRTFDDLSTEVLTVNLQGVLAGTAQDIPLKREDVIRISSLYDLQDEFYVQINGEVKNPGTYPFSKGMSVEELIVMAGGLREAANVNTVEIARRSEQTGAGTFADLIQVRVNPTLGISENGEVLQPFDRVIVRRKPNFNLDKVVQVEGQVNSPGYFAVESAEERISDLVSRAGGLTAFAYAEGATLIRRTEFFETESEQIRRNRNLQDLQDRLLADPNNTEAQELLVERLFRDLGNRPLDLTEGSKAAESKRESITSISETKADVAPIRIRQTEAVAIDLAAIMRNPGSDLDLILEEGDILSIPKQLQTVRMRGDVVYPATVRFQKERGATYYINRAGGFDIRANRKRTYVVYANGEVARTRSFLGIRAYPQVRPGAEIIIPTKGPRIPVRPGELVGIATGLATLVLVVTQINP